MNKIALLHGVHYAARYFLENVSGWILELDRGNAYPFEGNYSGWLEAKTARAAAEAKVHACA